ncbi:MAG: hypothetical protein L0I76_37380 [Pseudonocardia sp.]|nr:hypothetical protein [Pseudonocardia sp.]
MPQMSLFSAEARPAGLADLAGLLCGPGRIARFGAGDTARLDVPLPHAGRERSLRAVVAARDVALRPDDDGSVRSAYRRDLVPLARAWTGPHGAKCVPADFQLDGATLRLWALAAGCADLRGGYLLLLDPEAVDTHGPLVAATTRAGLPPARLVAGECGAPGPALRIHGARRVARLVELVGPAPSGLDPADWPRYRGRAAA